MNEDSSKFYNRFDLMSIRSDMQRNAKYLRISGEVLINIKKLNIQRKRKRGSRAGKNRNRYHHDNRVNKNNLITVATSNIKSELKQNKNLNFRLINIRSLQNKDDLLLSYILELHLDLCVIVETWLTDSEKTACWLQGAELNKNHLKLLTSNRHGKRSGGLGLLYNTKSILATEIQKDQSSLMEYCFWKIHSKSTIFYILGIYHTPQNKNSPQHHHKFMIDFAKLMDTLTVNYNNIIVMGDFNIHINDETDTYLETFKQDLDAFWIRKSCQGVYSKVGQDIRLDYN